jgi:hypothetical protein
MYEEKLRQFRIATRKPWNQSCVLFELEQNVEVGIGAACAIWRWPPLFGADKKAMRYLNVTLTVLAAWPSVVITTFC